MEEFAAAFLLISFLSLNVTFIWMIWSDNLLAGRAAATALIVFINAFLICICLVAMQGR